VAGKGRKGVKGLGMERNKEGREGTEERERLRFGGKGDVGMKRAGGRGGGRKRSGESEREMESHAFEFCQLQMSSWVMSNC